MLRRNMLYVHSCELSLIIDRHSVKNDSGRSLLKPTLAITHITHISFFVYIVGNNVSTVMFDLSN